VRFSPNAPCSPFAGGVAILHGFNSTPIEKIQIVAGLLPPARRKQHPPRRKADASAIR
jgi:hypothetical protein